MPCLEWELNRVQRQRSIPFNKYFICPFWPCVSAHLPDPVLLTKHQPTEDYHGLAWSISPPPCSHTNLSRYPLWILAGASKPVSLLPPYANSPLSRSSSSEMLKPKSDQGTAPLTPSCGFPPTLGESLSGCEMPAKHSVTCTCPPPINVCPPLGRWPSPHSSSLPGSLKFLDFAHLCSVLLEHLAPRH